MKQNLVEYVIDPANPPRMTPERRAELEALAARPDSEIDYSDIPRPTEQFWQNAVLFRDRHLYRPVKKSTTVRVDADMLEWFHPARGDTQGRGAAERSALNAALLTNEPIRFIHEQ